MVSQFSFFLNLYSSLLGGPLSSKNGFSKVIALFPHRLGTQVLFGLACTCFSAQLCTKAYTQLRSLWIQRQLEFLNRLIDHRNSIIAENTRRAEKYVAAKEDLGRDMEHWKGVTEELENILDFVCLDRELPPYPTDSIDDDASLIREQQDKEILSKRLAVKEFGKEVTKQVLWLHNEHKELTRLNYLDNEELQRIQNKVDSLSFFGLPITVTD